MSGGLTVFSPDKTHEYLNDLYSIELRNYGAHNWKIPNTHGTPPSPRKSHTALSYRNKDGSYRALIWRNDRGSDHSSI